jgi:hypothetical protein
MQFQDVDLNAFRPCPAVHLPVEGANCRSHVVWNPPTGLEVNTCWDAVPSDGPQYFHAVPSSSLFWGKEKAMKVMLLGK